MVHQVSFTKVRREGRRGKVKCAGNKANGRKHEKGRERRRKKRRREEGREEGGGIGRQAGRWQVVVVVQ